jgi:hypothetical protein
MYETFLTISPPIHCQSHSDALSLTLPGHQSDLNILIYNYLIPVAPPGALTAVKRRFTSVS